MRDATSILPICSFTVIAPPVTRESSHKKEAMPKKSANIPTRAAIVVAAGRGNRAGGDQPKQYRMIGGKALLQHTFDALADWIFDHIVIVKSPLDDRWRSLDMPDAVFVDGGATRTDSVRAGLQALRDIAPDHVYIHDAARPFITTELLTRLDSSLLQNDGVIPALPIVDAIKRTHHGNIIGDEDRDSLCRVQTPQAFHYESLMRAYDDISGQHVDDAAVAIAAGLTVATVTGEERNFKITYPSDFANAETLMTDYRIAVGTGYDVHQTCPGDHVWLCGVKVPAKFGLLGHSDADIGLHALVDAILGALAEGDIGDHFPPSDPKWKGAESWKFLDFCRERVEARNGVVEHVDVTLICEAPKIKPYRDAMRARIAEVLHLPLGRVGLKATTTEKLGFTGRGEGLAAQAVASLRIPL